MSKNFYSKQELDFIKSMDMVSILKKLGYNLVKERFSKETYHLKEHDSLKINANGKGWYWFSQGKGGNIIDFFMEYEHLSFPAAIELIYQAMNIDKKHIRICEIEEELLPSNSTKDKAKELILPAKDTESNAEKSIVNYLSGIRKIPEEIYIEYIKSGDIYFSKENDSIVFVGRDFEGSIVSAYSRSITDNSKKDCCGSKKEWRFRIENTESDVVNVFESEIDLLSYLAICPGRENYISLGGTSERALASFLSARNDIKRINLCLDNDFAGKTASQKIRQKYEKKYEVSISVPSQNDWNLELITKTFKEEYLKKNKECETLEINQ